MLLAGLPPFDTERDVFDSLAEYLTGHGHETYYEPDRHRRDTLVALVETAVHAPTHPVAYATVEIQWYVQHDAADDERAGRDTVRLQWIDTVASAFDVEQRYRDEDPFPREFTPTVGLHQDDDHERLGPNHWQIEFPRDEPPERHSVPYALVGEAPTTILDYFLRTAPEKLTTAHSEYGR